MAFSIHLRMSNGDEFTISNFIAGGGGEPLEAWTTAKIQLDSILNLHGYISTDQGPVIFTAHIASAEIRRIQVLKSDNPATAEPDAPTTATCSCCGRNFEDRLRFRDRPGETWSGVLERYKKEGVCPLCYNTFGFVHGNVKTWSDEIWNAFINDKLKNIQDPQALKDIEAAAHRKDPDLAGKVRHKIAELQASKKSADEARRRREAVEAEYAELNTKDEFNAFAMKYRQEHPDLAGLAETGFQKKENARLEAARQIERQVSDAGSHEELDDMMSRFGGTNPDITRIAEERRRWLVERELQEAESLSTVSVFIDKYASKYPDLVKIAKARRISMREQEHQEQLRFQHGPRYRKCASCVHEQYKVGILGGEICSCGLDNHVIKSPLVEGCDKYRALE